MFKRTKVDLAVALFVSGLMAVPAVAVAQGDQRVEITGSRIKRIDGETANPVQVITQEAIQRAGVSSVNELLQRLAGAGSALDDRVTNGFAPGGGSLNLRNLGFNSTLVLVNGRRLPTYPFAQQVGTPQGFNDTQNIPLNAVERIEVLKDGASAIYGADAVAGVVNIILRQDFKGVELSAGVGTSSRSDGNVYDFGLTTGFGTLDSNRFNVLLSARVQRTERVRSVDRDFAKTEDLRLRGGADRRSAYGFPGTIIDEIDPNGTGDSFFNVGGTCGPSTQRGGNAIRGAFCRYDRAAFGDVLPQNDRLGLYSRATLQLTPSISAFAELMFTRAKFETNGWPAGTTDDVGIGTSTIPAGYPGNPFPRESSIYYRFSDVGLRGNEGTTDMKRLVAGVRGTTLSWDWEAGANTNRIDIDNLAKNNTLNSRLLCLMKPAAAASYATGGDPLGLGTLDQIFSANPSYAAYFRRELGKCAAAFARFGNYNFVNPAANAPGVAEYLRWDSTRLGKSTLDGFDVRASRDLMALAGGPLAVAVGLETRREKVSDIPDEQLQTGDTLAISAAQAFGNRRITSAFVEFNAPVLKGLELNAALRNDKYSGNGSFSSTSPKFGLKWQPSRELLIRGTVSKAFRAPSLFETSPAQQTSFTFGITDPLRCPDPSDQSNPDCGIDVRRVQQGNPALKPERTTATTLGLVFEPFPDVSIAVDLWDLKRKEEIGSFADQTLVNIFAANPAIVVRGPDGRINQLNVVPVQLNRTRTNGVDVELRNQINLGFGRLTSSVGGTYVRTYKFTTIDDTTLQQATLEFNGTYNTPRWRTNWSFALATGNWEYSITGDAMSGYRKLAGRLGSDVDGWDQTNLGVSYSGFKNLTLRFGVDNVFDRQPPFHDETSGANGGYNAQFYDVVGRFFKLRANYKF